MNDPTIKAKNLSIEYKMGQQANIRAVNNVSFSIDPQEYFGLVGESGCGKSTVAQALIGGLDSNAKITSGEILVDGDDITEYSEKEFNQNIRWKKIAYIPQTSMNSLDPTMRLEEQAIDLITTHTDYSIEKGLNEFADVMETFGINKDRISDYPHQFSGGMQQRAMIALALFLKPSLVIADEPTTALDVLMQDQIFEFLSKAKSEFGISMLLITHDISVVFENCERIGVMHGGQMAESATASELYNNPTHPYTVLLQEAFPDIRYPDRKLSVISGEPPQLTDDVDYCTFGGRCPLEQPECHTSAPELKKVNGGSHKVACARSDEIDKLKKERGIQ